MHECRIYLSNFIDTAQSIERVVALINSAPYREEVDKNEFVDFNPAQLAGQFAANIAMNERDPTFEDCANALKMAQIHGANFDYDEAYAHASAIVTLLTS